MEWYLAYLLLGAFVGFFAGLLGIGGGLLLVPGFSLVFAAPHLGAEANLPLLLCALHAAPTLPRSAMGTPGAAEVPMACLNGMLCHSM